MFLKNFCCYQQIPLEIFQVFCKKWNSSGKRESVQKNSDQSTTPQPKGLCTKSVRTRACAYQEVRNVSFSENFAYVLNWWTLRMVHSWQLLGKLSLHLVETLPKQKSKIIWQIQVNKNWCTCLQFYISFLCSLIPAKELVKFI